MNELRADLPPLPERMRGCRVDKRGYPVPWFVEDVDGEPDFRVTSMARLAFAVNDRRCWTCGHPLGKHVTFVVGPMCAVNRISAEPPSHLDCAVFAAMACPFLSKPAVERRTEGVPTGVKVAGTALLRNPGVAVLWTTNSYIIKPAPGGVLFTMGEPENISVWCKGLPAVRDEIREAVGTGLCTLRTVARKEGKQAVLALERQIQDARVLLRF